MHIAALSSLSCLPPFFLLITPWWATSSSAFKSPKSLFLLSFLYFLSLFLPAAAAPGPAPLPACPGFASGPTPIRTVPSWPGARRRVWSARPVRGTWGPVGCQGWKSTPRGGGSCSRCCRPPQRYRDTFNDAYFILLCAFTFKTWDNKRRMRIGLLSLRGKCVAEVEVKKKQQLGLKDPVAWSCFRVLAEKCYWFKRKKKIPQGWFLNSGAKITIFDNLVFMCVFVCVHPHIFHLTWAFLVLLPGLNRPWGWTSEYKLLHNYTCLPVCSTLFYFFLALLFLLCPVSYMATQKLNVKNVTFHIINISWYMYLSPLNPFLIIKLLKTLFFLYVSDVCGRRTNKRGVVCPLCIPTPQI